MNRIISVLRDPILLLPKVALALDLVLWLFWLPVMLRMYTVPILLQRLAESKKYIRRTPTELRDVIGIASCVCNLRPFRSRFFPKLWLRQSLTLYRTLSRMGYPVEIHFGVRKEENNITGHSWVTIAGKPVADTSYSAIFKTVYSYP